MGKASTIKMRRGGSTSRGLSPRTKGRSSAKNTWRLRRVAASHGDAIGVYATAVLDHPLPWTKMRHLLGLVKKWGVEGVEAACRKALDADAIHVPLIGRMLKRGTEHHQ